MTTQEKIIKTKLGILELARQLGFSCKIRDKNGNKKILELIKPSETKLVRYIKIKGAANPFDQQYTEYFSMRRRLSNTVPI